MCMATYQQAEIDLWVDKLVVAFNGQLKGYSQRLPMHNTELHVPTDRTLRDAFMLQDTGLLREMTRQLSNACLGIQE